MFKIISKEIHKKGYIKFQLPSLKSELYLIKWNPRNETEIHGHGGKNCHFIILNGKLFETRYNNENSILRSNQLKKNKIYFINDNFGKHKVCNLDHKKTIWSLHRYL